MEYTAAVRQRFERLAYAAAPEDTADAWGEAGRSEHGASVQWLVWVQGGASDARLSRVRYRVYGCPHLLAAAELAAEQLEGGPVGRLAEIQPRALAEALGVPAEKLGRLLLIEDAARRCLAALGDTD